MSKIKEFVVSGKIEIPYKYFAGEVGSKFLIELRDRKKILGIRCPVCNRVYCPPKSTCIKCFSKLHELVELSDKGTLLTYTIVYGNRQPMHPLEPPFAYGVVQLDGADTGITHILGEADFGDIRIGMRVQAVFKEERQGSILDIKYFKPLY